MGYIVKGLDLNKISAELQAQVDQLIEETGGVLKAISKLATEFTETLTKGHEQTIKGLRDPATYRAFVESLTAEDLRGEDVTEECIEYFLSSSIEEKMETIDLLDIFTVYRLYEHKEAENAFTAPLTPAPETTERAYKGLENLQRDLRERLLKASTGDAPEGLQGLKIMRRSPLAESGDALELRRNSGTAKEDITITVTVEE